MDKLLKYLLEGKDLLEADETYEVTDEDPDVFQDEESPEPQEEPESPKEEIPEVGDDVGKVEPVEEEEIKKEYIGQEGDNHYYLEPNKEGQDDSSSKWVITNQLGAVVFDSAEQNITNVLDFLLAAKDELKLTMWTDEVFKKHFLPAIKPKDEPAEMDLETEEPEESEELETEEPVEPSDEEDIFMQPEEELEESKINEFMSATFTVDNVPHKITLIEDHSTRSSIFEIDGVRHKFTPDVTRIFRHNGKFTSESLKEFGEFIYVGMKDSDRVEI